MLANQNVMASIAVKDIEVARKFYGDTLGLQALSTDQEGVLTYQSGSALVVVYVSQYAGSNKATSAAWSVGDEFDSIMQALRAKGVTFEHYELPGLSLQGDVHVAGDFKAAWFKDPDGNILHVLNQ